MAASKRLTPAERRERALKAVNTRWANTPDRHAATAPGLRAAFQHYVKKVDPDGIYPEDVRLKMAENARRAHLAEIRFKALKARRAKNEETASEEAAPESTETPAPIADQCPS